MRKINYLLLLFAISLSCSLFARKVVVNNTTALKTAFNGALDRDTISVTPGVYNMGTNLLFPAKGLVVLQSNNKDSMAVIQAQISATTDSINRRSIIFQNIHLQGRYGNYLTNSAYFIDLNNKVFPFDTLAFRNCEISKLSRCLLRSGQDKQYQSGDLEWLEVTNCYFHEMNSSTNIWAILYLGHFPRYVNIRNNTFCDLPCAASILQLNRMQTLTGRKSEINFCNNTVVTTWGKTTGLISTGSFLGEDSEFNIKNNLLLLPNWTDEYNIKRDSMTGTTPLYVIPPIVKCIKGIITAHNNVVDSMRYWIAGQTIDADGNGGFVVIDTLNTYRMRDLNLKWTDMADPQGNDFSYLSSIQMAKAGTNGGIIGDPRWVKTFVTPRTLSVTTSNKKAVITPRRAFYENGKPVTVKASVVDGYAFVGWKNAADGTLLSTAYEYSFAINSDINLQAEYLLLQERAVKITVNGSKTATYKITPSKAKYFDSDQITITLDKHYINDFTGWGDGNMSSPRTLTVSGADIDLTANFTEHPYKLCWDFNAAGSNATYSNLAANFTADAANPGVMNYIIRDTLKATVSTRTNKFTDAGKELNYCMLRRTNKADFATPDYMYIKFSTKGLSGLKVKSIISTDNSIHKLQRMQYSTDAYPLYEVDAATGKRYTRKVFTTFKVDTISGSIDAQWRSFEGVLPVAAENKDSVWVRWIPDTSSEWMYCTGVTATDYEYMYISRVIVIDKNFSTANNDVFENEKIKIYSANNFLCVETEEKNIAEIYSLVGQKIMHKPLSAGRNTIGNIKPGVYLVKVGTVVQKVVVK